MSWAIVRIHNGQKETVSTWGDGEIGQQRAASELEQWAKRSPKRSFYANAKPGRIMASEVLKSHTEHVGGVGAFHHIDDSNSYVIEEVTA
jgi:hypothetical protein